MLCLLIQYEDRINSLTFQTVPDYSFNYFDMHPAFETGNPCTNPEYPITFWNKYDACYEKQKHWKHSVQLKVFLYITCMKLDLIKQYPKLKFIILRFSVQSEPAEYNEDQKNFMGWNSGQQYEHYDTSMMFHAPQPPMVQIPANVDYAGDLDFNILISSQTANRNSWIVRY